MFLLSMQSSLKITLTLLQQAILHPLMILMF